MRSERLSKRGKIALVTGGALGIGHQYCKRLAEDGADVIVVDLREADETMAAIKAAGASGTFFQCDLSDPAAIGATTDAILAQFGAIDILVNNAGVGSMRPLADIDYQRLRTLLAINLEAPFILCKAFAPGMKAKRQGRIINTTSATLNQVIPNFVDYIASKGGVMGLTRALATELGPFNITVNAIAPGLVRTPFTLEGHFGQDPTPPPVFEMVRQMQSVKQTLEAVDLAGTMSFLASDDAAFITGQIFHVDGGTVFV